MPTINLRDARNRNAQVRAESIGVRSAVRLLGRDGAPAKMRKVLRATMEHSFDHLRDEAGDEDKLGEALITADPEVDIERAGMFLADPARVYVNERGEIVYQINQIEVVRTPVGEEKERRPRRRAEPNVDTEIPVNWTGRLVKKEDALQRFVFASKLQIMHVNGLTYDFLYAMAKELAEAGSLMLLTAGKNGKEPLIFRHGATPYRGFLEGRVNGDKYVLLLHLSNQELKRPPQVAAADTTAATAKPAAAETTAAETAPAKPKTADATTAEAKAEATGKASPRKATVKDIAGSKKEIAALSGAKKVLVKAAAKSKATREKTCQASISAKLSRGAAKDASAAAATSKRPRPESARTKS